MRSIRSVIVSLTLMSMAAVSDARRPNFVLIMTDDQGLDDYGFRQPPLQTPSMDKMAREGVQFTRFYTCTACAPTRAALLTGRHFMRTGTAAVGFGGDAPHLDEHMLGQAMQDGGYVTGMMGKWNLGTSDAEMPSRRGFNESWEVASVDVRSYGRYWHFNAPFYQNGFYEGREQGWQVERVTDKAINFIERHKDEPFFLYLPYAQPHGPWHCPNELQEKYMQMGIGEAYSMFLGMMEQLDTQVGRVLKTLEQNGIADDTIVFFFGDNGPTPSARIYRQKPDGSYEATGESKLNATEWAARNPSGLRAQKGHAWEGGIRNRLSVYNPAKFTSKKAGDFVVVMDIFPTILDLAGISLEPDAAPLDGKSLRPLLEGDPSVTWPKKRRYLVGETGVPEPYLASDGWQYRFTKQHSWPMDKRTSAYVLNHWAVVNDHGEWGLFNLRVDPQQERDQATTRPSKLQRLQNKYNWMLRTVREDPHAWSDPVQVIGLDGVDDPYLEVEYAYRMRGENSVTWANTFFHEIGAIQELKIRVLQPATYEVWLYATKAPAGTRVGLVAGGREINAFLNQNGKQHDLGEISLYRGDKTMALTVLECDDIDALRKMAVFHLRLIKV